jgi:hypothetical protein
MHTKTVQGGKNRLNALGVSAVTRIVAYALRDDSYYVARNGLYCALRRRHAASLGFDTVLEARDWVSLLCAMRVKFGLTRENFQPRG